MAKLEMFNSEKNPTEVQVGEVIFSEGDAAEEMFVVIDGAVEIRKDGVVIDTAGPGDAVGEMALIDDGPRSATVTATADSSLAMISKARFERLVEMHPYFALMVMEQMAERLRRQTSA